ncbi:hypothetical protein VNI00_009744 [Paramarasmius palmivorus]|uniref:Uncharacterized protein n=1 Tax=Paramarasmius palmivorus TaxID=297713 RepID=A0AAW0CPE3_9AGAR
MKFVVFIMLLSTLSVVLSMPLKPRNIASSPLTLLGRRYNSIPSSVVEPSVGAVDRRELDRAARFQSRLSKKTAFKKARAVGQEFLSHDGYYAPVPPSSPKSSSVAPPAKVAAVPNTSVTFKSIPSAQVTESHMKTDNKKSKSGRRGGKRKD